MREYFRDVSQKRAVLFERIFVTVLIVCFIVWLSLIFLGKRDGRQFDMFAGRTGDFLADAVNTVGYTSLRDPYNNKMYSPLANKQYPPLAYLCYYPFSRLVNMRPHYEHNYFLNMVEEPKFMIIYWIVINIVIVTLFELIYRTKTGNSAIRVCTAFSILFSCPVLFTLERGNIILTVPIFLLIFVFFHDSNNRFIKEISLLSLAIAAGLKMTPAIFGLLLVFNKQWKETIRAIIYGLIFYLAPFLFFKGGLANLSLQFRNIRLSTERYACIDGCTIRNMIQIYFPFIHLACDSIGIKIISYLYGIIFCFYCLFSNSNFKKVLSLTLITIMVPNYSVYYYTIYLIPSVVLFLNEKNHPLMDYMPLAAFLLIFNPLQTRLNTIGIDYHLGMFLLLIYCTIDAVKCFATRRKAISI